MKNIIFLLFVFLFVKCKSQEEPLIGNWSLIEKNGEYKEFYIDNEAIRVIATSGAQANFFSYKLYGKTLTFPHFEYNVKYKDDCHIIWYNEKDTVYLERILINNFDIQKQGPNSFMLRKYNYLVSHNYISSDSAIKSIIDFEMLYQNRDTNIQEFEIIYQDSIIFKPKNKKN